jgi:hypothetical protein
MEKGCGVIEDSELRRGVNAERLACSFSSAEVDFSRRATASFGPAAVFGRETAFCFDLK